MGLKPIQTVLQKQLPFFEDKRGKAQSYLKASVYYSHSNSNRTVLSPCDI